MRRILLSVTIIIIAMLFNRADAQTLDEFSYLPIIKTTPRTFYDGAFSDTNLECGPWIRDQAFATLFPYCHDLIVYANQAAQRLRYTLPRPIRHVPGLDVVRVDVTRNYLRDSRKDVRIGLRYQGVEAWEWCLLKDPANTCSFRIDAPSNQTFDQVWIVVDYLGPGEMLDIAWLTMEEE